MLVEDGEEESLDAVREDPRLEAPAEEPHDAVLFDDVPHDLRVGDGLAEGLPGGLDHPQAVGDRVADDRRAEPDGAVAS